MGTQDSLIEVIEKLSAMMGEFEDRALNSDELADLTVKQLHYLDVIKKYKKPTFTDLAEEMGVTKPTVTLAVNKLINQGYVKKVQSAEDRRVYHLLLTEMGERVVDVHDKAHRDFARQFMKCLNDEELNQLVTIFKKVVKCE
ncbi:MarR family winged helix-turn-helix transcriptional regulator [Halothermothrix orenii]|uniref:Transcriptional regulator, MarR family n=1 Tax=Halothermothrix orenii (strain H 168 / OCM 544 / DSM 9562) TaxID=373903 RepID=B8D1T6_HALOH|nr:MarR family transcriptional regulator [Halothermothrix orenii]ACL69163.1 transcriptional regulator, MarR family [Halothermothrix orenii H 168]